MTSNLLRAALATVLSFLSFGTFACQGFTLVGTVLTITCPSVNLKGQVPPGAVVSLQKDARTGRPAISLQYPDNEQLFQGAKVYFCWNEVWNCEKSTLRNILYLPFFAEGTFHGNVATIQLPKVVDPSQLIGFVVLSNDMRGWLYPLN